MSTAPQTLQDLNTVLTSSASPAALLDKLMEVEGEVSLPTGSSHMTGDTELLRTYYCAYFFALFLCDEMYVYDTGSAGDFLF